MPRRRFFSLMAASVKATSWRDLACRAFSRALRSRPGPLPPDLALFLRLFDSDWSWPLALS